VKPLSVDVLLGLAVFAQLVSVLGVVLGATVYDRLHYAGAATGVAPFLVLAAVVVEEGTKSPSWNAGFVAFALLALSAALTHATARVARKRRRGDVEL
jgi:multisubunit Na+/H+ antiporter MnhG subunit